MCSRLGNPQPCFPEGETCGERAEFGMAGGEHSTREHSGQEINAEALALLRPVKGGHSLPEAGDRSAIMAQVIVGDAEVLVRQRLQDDFSAGRSERAGALSVFLPLLGQWVDVGRWQRDLAPRTETPVGPLTSAEPRAPA